MRDRRGFTLAETLLAVLILLLVSVIVATGIPAAKNAYYKVVLGANAQSLLSTTATALRNELGTAWDVEVSGKDVSYYKADSGVRATLCLGENPIKVKEETRSVLDSTSTNGRREYNLLPAKAATDKMSIRCSAEPIDDGDDFVVFNLTVYGSDGSTVIASLNNLAIKVLSMSSETMSNTYNTGWGD